MDNEKTKTNPPRESLLLFWNSVRHSVYNLDVEDSKLTEEHENRVRRHYNQLLSNLNVPDVVTQMFQSGKLTAKEYEYIRQFYSTPIRASEELLNIIIINSRDVYECFLELLKKTKQHHIYQMLTCDEESVCLGEQSMSKHSRLIRQNYDWLTKKLDLDSDLLPTLYAKEVLSQREYFQIFSERDQFARSEILLSIISRKSVEDFEKFTVVLNDNLQGHIAKRLIETPHGYANENVTTTVMKTLPTVCTDTFEKRIPPKPPPKPEKTPPTIPSSQLMVTKPMPLPKPEIHSSKSNRIEKRQNVTNLNITKKRSGEYLETKFRLLRNELKTEISTKIVQFHQRESTGSIWKITLTKMLEESRNVKRQNLMQAKANDENCERLQQEIIQRERECKIIKADIEREKTKFQKQLRELQERLYELEYIRDLAENENREMLAKLKKSEVEVEGLKTLNKHKDQEANEKKRIIKELKVQVTYSEIKLKETTAQLRETTDKLTESDVALKETKRNLEETQERLKETETKLTEFEAKLIVTEKGTDNLRSEDVEATLVDLKQNLEEEERTAWVEEKKQLMKQMQELQQESSGSRGKCFYLEQKLELEQTQKDDLKEKTKEYRRIIDELQDKYKSDPVLVHTMRIQSGRKKKLNILWFVKRKKSHAEEEDLSWHGMTILHNELFYVCVDSSKVEVFDSIRFSFSRRLNLKELIGPVVITSCKINKCLYIFQCMDDDTSGEIVRFDPNGKLIGKWSTDGRGWGLSITGESNVIFTVSEKNKFNEYSPDGQLIREIDLSSHQDIRYPYHAIKLTNGKFLVCHGRNEDDLHRVCVVDANGKLQKSFGGKYGSSIGQMENPCCVSVDGNGFVMVADCFNDRVLLLNSDLEFKRELLSKEKHGLGNPTNILFDEFSGRLFVADYSSNSEGRFLIFNVNK